ncbi:hypothetical protein [Corallococcus terminator]|uniref:Uncharacterized protein n=1 Tax=Corallococcus terminator TaxID=2316733 RepID=A0A3A8IIC0_9BACT|nr:hypothetical protein [Corallococcus terminator]RKG82378.1 hypothetical protein D7V88_25295 [Corallococcus terminator]
MHKTLIALAFSGLLSACGPDFDVVGVRAATAVRDADDHVTVTVVFTCLPVDGSELDGCDDEEEGWSQCADAAWFPGSPVGDPQDGTVDRPAATTGASECTKLAPVEGATLVLRSDKPVPRDVPHYISVDSGSPGDGPRVVLVSP